MHVFQFCKEYDEKTYLSYEGKHNQSPELQQIIRAKVNDFRAALTSAPDKTFVGDTIYFHADAFHVNLWNCDEVPSYANSLVPNCC